MDQKRIDDALESLARATTPAVPGNLEPNVWRRIRQSEDAAQSGLPYFWPRWLVSAGFLTGMIAVTIGIGLLTGTYAYSQQNEARLANSVLHLQIFTNHVPMLENPAASPDDK